ncbi:outer-membrane receptor for ferric coprogen and ferric-rhodotorulic acid [Shinella sp. WSC3-e]|nr:Outer membrane receptor for ferric coprogen and ferric-rhodotorulic acid [Rhizobiaceae bacterium]CAK7258115.1 outer-membrane receptor for ferric coprogen and ferric-rhodotorulic acid [Shinella sp. WSC3-e]
MGAGWGTAGAGACGERKQRRSGRVALVMMTSGLAIAASLYMPAHAQTPTSGRTARAAAFAIPAQPLSSALVQFANATGIQLFYDANLVRGKSSGGAQGALSRSDALNRILAGTGLVTRINGNTVTIVDPVAAGAVGSAVDGSTALETITVGGSATTEGSNSYTTSESTIGKTSESLRETPQSVTVITSRQIQDRGITTLAEALDTATGVTVTPDQYYGSGRFFSRGFEINNIRVDGGAVGVTSAFDTISAVDLVKYDRVEVLRGADGLYSGNGEAGGVISLARKRPLDTFQASGELSAGSWNTVKSVFDVTGPLTQGDGLRGRFVGAFDRTDAFYDISDSRNLALYGVLEADVTDNTSVMLGGSYDKKDSTPWTVGLPRYADGSAIDFPVSTSLGTDWSYLHHENWEVFGEVKHVFDNGWTWTTTGSYAGHKYDAKYGFVTGVVDPVTKDGLSYNGSYNWGDGYQVQLDTHVDGAFEAFGREHEIVVGLDYSKHSSNVRRGEFAGPAVNLDDLKSSYWSDSDTPAFPSDYYFNFYPYGEERYGAYARGRFEIADPLHVIVGARYGNYGMTFHRASYNRDGSVNWTEALDYNDNGVLTPFGAVTYDITDQWTAYASYADIYKSQARYLRGPEPGTPLEPVTGRTYEVGLKGELLNSGLNTGIALYHTTRNGEAVYDPTFTGAYNPDNGSSCCYTASGDVVSRGIDLEVSGEVVDGLQLFAGYTLNVNENKGADTFYGAITPKHLVKLWAAYNLPGEYSAWTLGAGVRAQSRTTVKGTEYVSDGAGGSIGIPYTLSQGAYAVADVSLRYDVNATTSVTLNVNNLFNEKYFSQLGSLAKNNVYGEPRNFLLTLRSTF